MDAPIDKVLEKYEATIRQLTISISALEAHVEERTSQLSALEAHVEELTSQLSPNSTADVVLEDSPEIVEGKVLQ